jgi:hypothetical protein
MMNRKWMPITAGIIDIIGGISGLCTGLSYFIEGIGVFDLYNFVII